MIQPDRVELEVSNSIGYKKVQNILSFQSFYFTDIPGVFIHYM